MPELKVFEKWWLMSDEDLSTAETIYEGGHFINCLFMCHMSVEKALKGLWLKQHPGSLEHPSNPPYTHSLLRLRRELVIALDEELEEHIILMDDMSVPLRYDFELKILDKSYSKAETAELLYISKRLQLWIREQ